MEVRYKKRPRGFKKEAQGVQVSPLNPLSVAPWLRTVVIGAVGPEHWTRVPPRRPVTSAMTPAERMPTSAPRPDESPAFRNSHGEVRMLGACIDLRCYSPNAAPSAMAAKEVVRPNARSHVTASCDHGTRSQ